MCQNTGTRTQNKLVSRLLLLSTKMKTVPSKLHTPKCRLGPYASSAWRILAMPVASMKSGSLKGGLGSGHLLTKRIAKHVSLFTSAATAVMRVVSKSKVHIQRDQTRKARATYSHVLGFDFEKPYEYWGQVNKQAKAAASLRRASQPCTSACLNNKLLPMEADEVWETVVLGNRHVHVHHWKRT